MSDTESKNLFSFLVYSRVNLLWLNGDNCSPLRNISRFWWGLFFPPVLILFSSITFGIMILAAISMLLDFSMVFPMWHSLHQGLSLMTRKISYPKRLIQSHNSTSVVSVSHLSHLITANKKLFVPRTCTLQSTEQVELHDYLQTAVLGIILDLSFHKHWFSSMSISSQHIFTVANKQVTRKQLWGEQ